MSIYKLHSHDDGSFSVSAQTFPACRKGEFGNTEDRPEERTTIRTFDCRAAAEAFLKPTGWRA